MSQSPFALGDYYELPDRSAVVDVTARITKDGYAITATFVRLDVAGRTDERTWSVRTSAPVKDLAGDGWAVDPESIANGPTRLEGGPRAELNQLLARSAKKARHTANLEERQARQEIMELRAEVAALRASHPTVASLELLAMDLARQGQQALSDMEYLQEEAEGGLAVSTAVSEYAHGLGDAFTNAARNIQRQIISVEMTGGPPEPRYDDTLNPDHEMGHEVFWSARERLRQYGILNGPTMDFPDPASSSLRVRHSTPDAQTSPARGETAPTIER